MDQRGQKFAADFRYFFFASAPPHSPPPPPPVGRVFCPLSYGLVEVPPWGGGVFSKPHGLASIRLRLHSFSVGMGAPSRLAGVQPAFPFTAPKRGGP